jgi:hypothetical protein
MAISFDALVPSTILSTKQAVNDLPMQLRQAILSQHGKRGGVRAALSPTRPNRGIKCGPAMLLTFLSSSPSSSPSPLHLGQISSPSTQPEDPQIDPPPDGKLQV